MKTRGQILKQGLLWFDSRWPPPTTTVHWVSLVHNLSRSQHLTWQQVPPQAVSVTTGIISYIRTQKLSFARRHLPKASYTASPTLLYCSGLKNGLVNFSWYSSEGTVGWRFENMSRRCRVLACRSELRGSKWRANLLKNTVLKLE